MTNRARQLTDGAIHQALVDLAGPADGGALLEDVLRAVESTPQLRRSPWSVPPMGRGAMLLAAVVVSLGIGAAIALSQLTPDRRPGPTPAVVPDARAVPEFVLPFRYVIPDGETDPMTQLGGRGVYPIFGLFRGSGNLAIFEVTGSVHTCRLEESPESPTELVPVTVSIGQDPPQLIERLRDRVGLQIGDARPSTLGSLPATEAEIGPTGSAGCHPQAHLDGMGIGGAAREPELRGPGKIIVARAGRHTVAVLIKAADQDAYDVWLPIAEAYVASFDFYTLDN